jgi:hypothetical protein
MALNRAEWLKKMTTALLPDGPRALTLDEIGEVIGTQAVGADLVEALIDHLQSLGAEVRGGEDKDLAPLLRDVLSVARTLRLEGQTLSPQKIAERSGISARAVKVALLYARVLSG